MLFSENIFWDIIKLVVKEMTSEVRLYDVKDYFKDEKVDVNANNIMDIYSKLTPVFKTPAEVKLVSSELEIHPKDKEYQSSKEEILILMYIMRYQNHEFIRGDFRPLYSNVNRRITLGVF